MCFCDMLGFVLEDLRIRGQYLLLTDLGITYPETMLQKRSMRNAAQNTLRLSSSSNHAVAAFRAGGLVRKYSLWERFGVRSSECNCRSSTFRLIDPTIDHGDELVPLLICIMH